MEGVRSIMSGLMQKSLDNLEVNESDYMKDGLLYCGKCHTPKQMHLRVFNEDHVVGISCKCKQESDRAEKEAEARFNEQQRIEMNKLRSGLSAEQRKNLFETAIITADNEKQFKYCKNYAEKFDEMYRRSQGLLLFGSPGTGKSFLASCIANKLLAEGKTVTVTSTIDIVGKTSFFKDDEHDEYVDSIVRPDLLIVDDLGAERSTDFALERVHDIIEYRVGSRKPMIVTTNYSLEQFKRETDIRKARTFDRIASCCFPIAFTGDSFRKKRGNSSYSEIRKMLEG